MKFQIQIKISISILFIALGYRVFGQSHIPSVLILAPNEITLDEQVKMEIDKSDISEYFYKNISEKFAEKFTDLFKARLSHYHTFKVTLAKERSSDALESLAFIADTSKIQYIINFPSVTVNYENSARKIMIRVQLYDDSLKKFRVNRDFSLKEGTPIFNYVSYLSVLEIDQYNTYKVSGFDCNKNTLWCDVLKVLNQPLKEVFNLIDSTNLVVKNEKLLAINRSKVFASCKSERTNEEVSRIIRKYNPDTFNSFFYAGIIDSSKTKLLAFFAFDTKILKSNSNKKSDLKSKLDQLFYNQEINDWPFQDCLDSFKLKSKIIAYVETGFKSDSNWNFRVIRKEIFNSSNLDSVRNEYFNNLQKWHYFEKNTDKIFPFFWESTAFEEKDNRNYDEIVKDGKAVRKQVEINKQNPNQWNREKRISVGEQLIQPYIEELKKNRPEEFVNCYPYSSVYSYRLPNDWSVILQPFIIDKANGQRVERYFVLIPEANEFYEWTFLESILLRDKGKVIRGAYDLYDLFNFIGRKNLFEKHVLKKDGNKYTYLKRMN